MRHPELSLTLLAIASVTCRLAAQSGDGDVAAVAARTPAPPMLGPTHAAAQVTPQQALPGNAWRSPIHTSQADPVGGAYGTWTAALTYKASFHDGFAFYPFLGPDYKDNLPLRWNTESITAGGEPIADVSRAQHHHTDWRYEYRYGGVTEAYDVREEGVEQLFVIWQRPTRQGDVVVTGRVATQLRVDASTPLSVAHQALTFNDDAGKPLVRYGEAYAIDATGRRINALTSFDGSRIRLTVPGDFVAQASFPLTIDPLTARVIIATWGGATFGLSSYPEVGRDDESTADNLMTFYSRQFSASDFDAYARLSNDDFSGSSVVMNDVTASWSTVRAGVAFVGAADRWALCLQRDFPATAANTVRVRIYFHDKANTTLNSGLVVFHDPAGGECNWYPSVGGTNGFSASGLNALMAYQADVTATKSNTTTSKIYTVLVNCSTRTIGARAEIDNGVATDDNEFPDVNQESDGGSASWIVAWEQFNNSIGGDDVDVICSRVESNNTQAGHFFMGTAGGSPLHKLQPQVSGRAGRYCVSMIRSGTRTSNGSGFGSEIMVERFNWSETSATPTKLGPKTLINNAPANFVNGGIAHDDNTSSHWALVYQRGGFVTGDTFVIRVGHSGGDTETATLYSGPNGSWSPNIAFNDDGSEFQCVYGSNDDPPSGLPVYGQRLQYPATALNVLYGAGCGPGTIGGNTLPYAGHEFYRVSIGGVAGGTPSVLFCAAAPAAIGLGFIGMPGCFANYNPGAFLFNIGAAAPGNVQLTLPDDPAFIGNLYFQWAYLAPGLNPAGLGATQGLRTQVR